MAFPLTRRSLNQIAHALRRNNRSHKTLVDSSSEYLPQTASSDPLRKRAAVLIPLCNFAHTPSKPAEPGILLTVRGSGLRTHSSEVSFPGGREDQTDPSLRHTALRETHEELGICSSHIEVLGELRPAEISLNGLLVSVYVAFVHSTTGWRHHRRQRFHDRTLPSIDMDHIRRHIAVQAPLSSDSQSSAPLTREVDHAFHLPFDLLLHDTRRRRLGTFRREWGQANYWAIAVDDLVYGTGSESDRAGHFKKDTRMEAGVVDSEIGSGGGHQNRLEVWGLTGWYLNLFLRVSGIGWDDHVGRRP